MTEGTHGSNYHFLSMSRGWCEQMETILVEEEVTPHQEDLVPCTSLYHYLRLGW